MKKIKKELFWGAQPTIMVMSPRMKKFYEKMFKILGVEVPKKGKE